MKIRFILIIICIPFLIIGALHIGIWLGNILNFSINIPGVEASDWFMFFSGYLGGVMTYAGVILTIRFETRQSDKQRKLDSIISERNNLGNILSEIDLYGPASCYQEYSSFAITINNEIPEYSLVRKRIVDNMGDLNKVIAKMRLMSDFLSVKMYEDLVYKIINALNDAYSAIDKLIVYDINNHSIHKEIFLCSQVNDSLIKKSQPPAYDDVFFENLRNEIKDLNSFIPDIQKKLDLIKDVNSKDFSKIIEYCNQYISEKINILKKNSFNM